MIICICVKVVVFLVTLISLSFTSKLGKVTPAFKHIHIYTNIHTYKHMNSHTHTQPITNIYYIRTIRTTYNLRIRDHSSTSSYPLSPWFTFNKRSAYRILSIVHSSIYSSNCPSYISASLVQRAPLPSFRNHASHLLSTPILRPSKMNTRALSYIGPKLWNSLPPYIRSIKSHKTFMKYIQQLISGGNLNY